ncbi:MAG: GtrA family protein [Oscillospiraceae bacterium]|nr:GtrA family protein [Oscillospiraceae bacterium]
MNKKNLWQMLKYAIFSVSAGVIQTVSFILLYNVIFQEKTALYDLSYIVSLVLSILWNFTLNRKYTFQAVVNVPVAMLKVAAFYLVFTPVSTWLGQIAVDAGWNGNLVQILTMFANFVLEFAYFKFVVFKGKDEKTQK